MSDRRLLPQFIRRQLEQQERERHEQEATATVYQAFVSSFSSSGSSVASTTQFLRGGVVDPGNHFSSSSSVPVGSTSGQDALQDTGSSTSKAINETYILGRELAKQKSDGDDYDPMADSEDEDKNRKPELKDEQPPPTKMPRVHQQQTEITLGTMFSLTEKEVAERSDLSARVAGDGPVQLSIPSSRVIKDDTTANPENMTDSVCVDPDIDRELHREREMERTALLKLQEKIGQQQQRSEQGMVTKGSRKKDVNVNDQETTNVFVGNITQHVTEMMLFQRFSAYGPIASVKIMKPRTPEEHMRHHTNGFVAFMNRRDAEKAKADLEGAILDGSPMKLDWGAAIQLPPVPIHLVQDISTGAFLLTHVPSLGQIISDNCAEQPVSSSGFGSDEGTCGLDDEQMAVFQNMLETLTMTNTSVRSAMGLCCDNSKSAREIAQLIAQSFQITAAGMSAALTTEVVASLLAKLFLVNDLLYNSISQSSRDMAAPFRSALQDVLPSIFDALIVPSETAENRVALMRLNENVRKLLRTWDRWGVFPQPFLTTLRDTFASKQQAQKNILI